VVYPDGLVVPGDDRDRGSSREPAASSRSALEYLIDEAHHLAMPRTERRLPRGAHEREARVEVVSGPFERVYPLAAEEPVEPPALHTDALLPDERARPVVPSPEASSAIAAKGPVGSMRISGVKHARMQALTKFSRPVTFWC